MHNNHSIFKVSLMFLALSGILLSATSSLTLNKTTGGLLRSPFKRAISTQTAETLDPSKYTEVSSAELTPKIVSYTGTSLSRHLNVQFESKVINAYAPSTKDVFYVIDDARYTGDRSDPFNTEVPDKTLNGFVYNANAATGQTTMYISNTISYGSKFTIKNLKIASGAMYQTIEHDVSTNTDVLTYDSYKSLTTIYICDGIEEVDALAFQNVPNTVTFKCLAASKPAGWADNWTDADPSQVEWGAVLDDATKAAVKHSGSTTSFGDAEDYILGYKGNDDIGFGSYPLTVSYKKTDANGNETIEYQTLPVKHQTNPYDAVGSKIYGKTSSFEITINVKKGETIDQNSYHFYNIFKAKRFYIEKKSAWPQDEVKKVFDNYSVPLEIEETNAPFIPVLEGNNFFYQAYESEPNRYLTIAQEFDTEEAANALVDEFKTYITSFEIDKSVSQTEDNLKYEHLDKYDNDLYGNVYRMLYKKGDIRTHVYVQFYAFFDEAINKYEFVTYIVLDNPVDELDEEGKATGNLLDSMSPFPIVKKAAAIRPFIYVPDYDEVKSDSGNVIARLPKSYLSAAAIVRFSNMIDFDDILTTEYRSSSKFLSYSAVSMKVDKVLGTAYAGFIKNEDGVFDETGAMKAFTLGEDGKYYNGSTAYEKSDVKITDEFIAPLLYINDNSSRGKVETNLASIIAGDYKFRFTFSNLNSASLIVDYRKGNEVLRKELAVNSPSPVIEINGDTDNIVSFLLNNDELDGIDTKDILGVGVSGMTVSIHLYNTSSHSIVQNTQYDNVFGDVEVLPYSENALSFFDINVYLIVFFLALIVLYVLVAIALFFYKKNKYKNDEFRRMRPKAYVKSAALGFVGLLIVSAAVNFIIMRFGVFYSTVPTYNPIDAFVIAFGIFGAISIGFFIKNAVTAIKLMKKRQEIKKLHLDTDVEDDGTH